MSHTEQAEISRRILGTTLLTVLMSGFERFATCYERSRNEPGPNMPEQVRRIIENRNYYI